MPTQYPTRRSNSSPTKVTAPATTPRDVTIPSTTADNQEMNGSTLAGIIGGALGSMVLITSFATILFIRNKKNGNNGIDEGFVA